jgi:hypothetical protein
MKDLYINERDRPIVKISKEVLGACLKVFPREDPRLHTSNPKDSSLLRILAFDVINIYQSTRGSISEDRIFVFASIMRQKLR